MSSNSEAQQRPELPATHASTALSPQHPLHQSTVNSRPAPSAQPLHQTELYDNDLPQILNALSFISVDNVINFGLNLKVSRSTIVGFERQYNGNMKDCLREILNERLKQEPPLTWHDIVTALRSPSVCEDRLASQIESQYMTHSQPPSSVPQHRGTQLSSVPQHPQCQHSYLIHSQYPSLLTPSLCSHHEPQFYFNQLYQSPCKPIIVPRPYPVHTQSQASSHTLETSPHFVSTLSGFAITSSTTNTTQSNIRSQASTSSTDTTQSPAVSRGSVEQVKTSIENFECEFSDLKSTAREELSDRESQDSTFLGRFCDHLVDLPLSKKTLHKKFFHESKNDIVNAKSIREQFFILGGYCNYTNYGIIHHIIKRFCGELLKRRMEVYQESLTMFEMDTPVNIYLCAITSNDPNSVIHQKFNRMVLKINKPTSLCRLHEIRALTEAMGENSSVYPYCMYIGAISSNCVCVVLYIPPGCTRDVVGAVTPDFLLLHKLMEVSVNGQDITHHWIHDQSPGKELHSNSPQMLSTAVHPLVSQEDITKQTESQWMTQPQPPFSVPQEEGTQLPSVPQQKTPRLSSVPQKERNQPPSVPQQVRAEFLATHTSAMPSPPLSLFANLARPQPSLHYSMRQPLLLPQNYIGHSFSQPQSSREPLQSPNPPPHHLYLYPQNLPSQPFSLPQSSHPLQQTAQHLTHLTLSSPHSHYHPPLQIRQTDHSLYQLPTPQSLPHPLNYPPTQLHSNINCSPQDSPQYPPAHPPSSQHPHPAHQSQYIQSHSPSHHSPYPSTHILTQYTQYRPSNPPTDHQPPTSYQYQPPVRHPLLVSSISHPSPQSSDGYGLANQSPQVPGTHSVSGSVSEETVPPAKIARLEPSIRPYSHLSQYQHNITDVGTTDRIPSLSQLRTTQTTAHPTPPNPPLTDDSRQPTPTHTSVTPPLQSHSQSSGSDHPQTTTAVSKPLAHDQSKLVEDVINRHTSFLTEAFGNNLLYFTGRFLELGLLPSSASDSIHTVMGVGNRHKGGQLLRQIIGSCRISCDSNSWFQAFLSVFLSEAVYKDLAKRMEEEFKLNSKHNSSFVDPPPNPSLQPHSCTSDRPSLSSEVGRSHVMSHNEPQSVHTQSQTFCHRQSSHMQYFIKYVKTVYRGSEVERDPKVVKLQKMPTKVYINLVCIDRKRVDNAREYDEVTRTMVQEGSLDVVHGKKWPTEFNEISNKLPATSESFDRVVLVEGAPGVGKSTFAWEFCRRWERGEIAQQYQLVLLLRLREERISNAKSLEDLIYHPSMEVCQTVKRELEYNLGVNTLIILEGFDELPDRCRKDGSIFMDLIAGKLLRLATVLVTSRPWATRKMLQNLQNRIYQHIEILGFTGHQITEYIESALPQNKVSDLKAYLESHPQIRAGMYIPLNSAIVVTVYEESQSSGCAMPTTLTELYTSLARTLLCRYLRGHPEYGTDFTIYLQTFKELPRPVYEKFCEVCELAYNGTVGAKHGVKLIYRKSDMPSDFDDLGFMDSVIELYETRPEATSYNFLHLTFQEFFAAVHISRMSPTQQLEHFKTHKEGRLKVVLMFLAGLNKLNCLSKEQIADNFFQTPSTREGSRYLISCDAAVGIELVQWLFEAQSDDVIEHVLGQKTIEFGLSSQMLPLDYYSLGYCISHSQCQWILGLGKKIGEDEVRMLASGAGTRREPKGRVIELKRKQTEHSNSQMNDNKSLLSLSGKCLSMLFTEWKWILCLHQLSLQLSVKCERVLWPNLSALRVLEIMNTGIHTEQNFQALLTHLSLESLTVLFCSDRDCAAIGNHVMSTTSLKELCISSHWNRMEYITAALVSNQSLPLERLVFKYAGIFTATAGDSLAQFITNTTTLKCLSINKCTFSPHALLVLARATHHNSILQTKNVEGAILTVDGDNEAKDLAQLHVEYPELVKHVVDVTNKSISDAGAIPLARALHRNSTLTELSNSRIRDSGAVALAQALHHNSTPTELNLSKNSISDAGAVALAQGLHHNSTLTRLDLSNNGICDAGAVALAQALHHNSTLTRLDLSNNGICDAGAVALAQALHHNSTLTRLDLANNSVCDAGAAALAEGLHHNSTLTWLFFSNNSICDAGAVALAQGLHHNSTLTWLDLSNNSISDAGAVAIAQALHHNSTVAELYLFGNDGIAEKGTRQLVQALTVNTSINKNLGLRLPRRCVVYARQYPEYHTVKHRIYFY